LVEITITLDSFRNIDLFFQGAYFTHLKLYSKKEK
jgi:hypothetical protein